MRPFARGFFYFLGGKGLKRYDVAVIGAGVTGCAIARVLSRYDISVVLVEAKEDVAMGASRANSAIVHAGYDCEPGTLMAKLNVLGNEMFSHWCEELDVELKRVGSYVIALTDEDKGSLDKLMARGAENGVPGLEMLTGDEARALEPALSKSVRWVLHAKTGGITCPYKFTIAAYENARQNGVEALFDARAKAIERVEGGFIVSAGVHTFFVRRIINAAGIYADEVSNLVGDDSFTIHARKGEYMLLDRTASSIQKVIFQTPSALGKGILVSPTVDGNAFLGPTAVDIDDKEDTSVSEAGMEELVKMARLSVPDLNLRAVITSFAGIRAIASGKHDFIIRPSSADPRFIQASGICSPGLTSAPAIAEMVAELVKQSGLSLPKKAAYEPRRVGIRAFRHMTREERKAAIDADSRFGRVVCRCETITEAEISEAIARGARSLDAVKRRVRAGMGRCQGGFCSPRVMELLARAQGVALPGITKFGGASTLVYPMDEGGQQNED